MTAKNYYTATGLIFAVFGTVHLLRLVFGWPASIAGWDVPVWLSAVAVVVAGYLSYSAYRLMK